MGSVIDFISKLVSWIGDMIYSVVKWFEGDVRVDVENKTQNFLEDNEQKISSTENPKQVAKVAGEMKALKELQKVALEEKKKLSDADQSLVNELFKNDPDFFSE